MSKFVVLDSHVSARYLFDIEKSILEENGIECVLGQCKTESEVIEAARDADGIGVIYNDINRNVISQLKNCKMIVRYGIGYDNIDVTAATERGIIVCNLPDYCQPDVATTAMALLLDLVRKVTLMDRHARSGHWDRDHGYPVNRLSSLTLGLVGFGSIARTFVKYLSGFSMNIVAYDPYAADSLFDELHVRKVSLNDLFEQSDVVSLHTPLTPDTRHLINRETISRMKDGVYIINTARGPIIDQDALIEALQNGKIKAAALDVVEYEPIFDKNHVLYSCENLIVNPHIAFNSVEAATEMHEKVAFSAIDVLNKRIMPYNAVNKHQLQSRA